jgi:glycosyltransferase involved in cell wall biosynthesis
VGPPRGAVHAPVTVLYHGSIVPARVPLTVIDALAAQLRPVKLVIAGYETIGHRGHVNALMERARALGIADRVEYLGVIPARRDLLQVCARCDVGLALMPLDSADTSEQSMAGASNKAFDYLAHGLALIVSDLADWREMFVDAQFARACDPRDVRSLAAALRALLDDPSEMRAMGERGRRRVASEWFYEHAFAPVLDRMTKTVAAGTVATPAAAARIA